MHQTLMTTKAKDMPL